MQLEKILQELASIDPFFKEDHKLFDTRDDLLAWLAGGFFWVISLVLALIKLPLQSLLVLFVSVLFMVFFATREARNNWTFLKQPVSEHNEILVRREGFIQELMTRLLRYEKQDLQRILKLLSRNRDRIPKRTALIFGTIEKMGIFPVLLGLFYAYYEYQKHSESLMVPVFVAGFLSAVFLAYLSVHRTRRWLDHATDALSDTIELKNEQPELRGGG